MTYCKCHKTTFKRGGSHIDFLDWIKKKRAKKNPDVFNMTQQLH